MTQATTPPPAKEYMPVVQALLAEQGAQHVLDAPSGSGWLAGLVGPQVTLDGINLYADVPPGYRHVSALDLNLGLPEATRHGGYDAAVSCEGLEHVSNPLLLTHLRDAVRPGGLVVITTPNTWYPAARLQYLLRGFFLSFPSLVGRIVPGTGMHVMPWNFANLYLHLHLRLAGLVDIRLVPTAAPAPKHALEWLIGWPTLLYCRRRLKRADTTEERQFWADAGHRASLFGRRLVVRARRPD